MNGNCKFTNGLLGISYTKIIFTISSWQARAHQLAILRVEIGYQRDGPFVADAPRFDEESPSAT